MRSKLMTTALALVLAAPGLALAQQTEPATDPASPGMATTPPPVEGGAAGAGDTTGTMGAGTAQGGGSAAQPPASTTAESLDSGAAATSTATAADQGGGWWSGMGREEIVGQTLYDAEGEEIGEIDNVVLNAQGGEPAAVVDMGGFLGIGSRSVTIPLDQIQKGTEDRLTTSMSKDELGQLPAYEEGGGWSPLGEGQRLGGGAGNQ